MSVFKPPTLPCPRPGISKQEQESKITLWNDNNVQNLLIELSLLEKKWDLGREPGRGRRRCDDRWMDRWRKEGQEEGRRGDGSHGREVKQSMKGWGRRVGGEREEGTKRGQVWHEQCMSRIEEEEKVSRFHSYVGGQTLYLQSPIPTTSRRRFCGGGFSRDTIKILKSK